MGNVQEVGVRTMDGGGSDGLDSRRRPADAGSLELVVKSSVREVHVEQTSRNISIKPYAVECQHLTRGEAEPIEMYQHGTRRQSKLLCSDIIGVLPKREHS